MADRSVSRGEVISLIAGIPLGVAAVTTAASAADNKAQFKYVAKSTKPGQTCSNCSLFTPGPSKTAMGKCKVVTGPIAPGGWCIAYAPKAK